VNWRRQVGPPTTVREAPPNCPAPRGRRSAARRRHLDPDSAVGWKPGGRRGRGKDGGGPARAEGAVAGRHGPARRDELAAGEGPGAWSPDGQGTGAWLAVGEAESRDQELGRRTERDLGRACSSVLPCFASGPAAQPPQLRPATAASPLGRRRLHLEQPLASLPGHLLRSERNRYPATNRTKSDGAGAESARIRGRIERRIKGEGFG